MQNTYENNGNLPCKNNIFSYRFYITKSMYGEEITVSRTILFGRRNRFKMKVFYG